ncbi:hypothetical protein DL770_005001 [Monosporascus sp. CRB-9-2]|nr:hypothetical protein DL770_005001 [Monosporascus sp. CRB-9-2]
MAEPLSDNIYLPPLEPCLKGENVILSWRHVASALADPSGHRQSGQAVIDFLTDPYVQSLFTKPGSAFESQGDKSPHHDSFVKKTAAIQVTPTPNEKYDINVLKEDALWLSKNARVNEVAALRVVVIEFQSRPRSQLLGPISAQDVANIQEAAGATNAHAAYILPGLNLSGARDATEIQTEFEKPESRRRRIFQIYLAERRFYSATADYIFTLMLQERLPKSPPTDATRTIRTSFLKAYGIAPKQSRHSPADMRTNKYQTLAWQHLNLLPEAVQLAQSGLDSIVEDRSVLSDELGDDWLKTVLTEMLHRMTVAFQLLDLSSDAFVSPPLALLWFSLVGKFVYLGQLGGFREDIAELMLPLQSLVCVISLTILNLSRVTALFEGEVDLDTDAEYIVSPNTLGEVHEAILSAFDAGAVYAVPVLFAWVPIVHKMSASYQERAEKRDAIQNQKAVENYDSNTQMIPSAGRRNSAGSITTIDKRSYDDFLVEKNFDRDIARVEHMAVVATQKFLVYEIISAMATSLGPTDGGAFAESVGSRMRVTLSELLKATYLYVDYRDETVTAMRSVLSGGRGFWDLSRPTNLLPTQDILAIALKDEVFLAQYFQLALHRFPYEFTPFLSFCRTLFCSFHTSGEDGYGGILPVLHKTSIFTFVLPDDFVDYHLTNEEDNANTFQLLEDLPLITPISNRGRIAADEEECFVIPAGSIGRFIADEGRIVSMQYEYSILALLGKRLETNVAGNNYRPALGVLSLDEVAEIISLFATLVRMQVIRASKSGLNTELSEGGLAILAEASRALPRTKDLVSVICDTLDSLLDQNVNDSGLAVVKACIEFLHAVIPLCPGRVWSYMARCAILSNESQGGRLSRLVGNLELSTQQFGLLVAAIRLFSSLVDSAMESSIQRKASSKARPRQQTNENVWVGISDRIITQITVSIAHTAVDALESSSTWRFSSELDRSVLIQDVVPIMNNLILYTYSIDDITTKKTLTAPLEPAAEYIVNSFLAPSAGSLRIQPLLASLVAATQLPQTTAYANRSETLQNQTIAVLNLATSLVRVANYFDRSSTTIETQFFKATPFVARVCAVADSLRKPGIALLEALVISAGKTVGEPPSLLGYLGPQTSWSFLQLLSTLDRPFNQAQEVHAIWRFFSTIVRNRQQWMANCLLTGKTPREARNGSSKTAETSSSSVLSSALKRLASISSIDRSEVLSILDFITSAQNHWPWTIFTLQKDTDFVTQLRSFVRNLKSSSVTAKTNVLQACDEARIAAYVAEIFAMQLFHLRQIDKASSFANELTRDLDYYLRDGVAVSGYNRALHVTFSRNFSNQYPGVALENFKRTLLEPRSLGEDFYYSLSFANKMLRFDNGWVGPRNSGFKSEMEKANANLSLVDAQISLYHSWEFLLMELSTCLPQNDTLKKQSLQVAEQCLEANQESQGHEQIFERLAESRVNLALMLVQRVVDSAPSAGDVAQLLNALWSTVSSIGEPYVPENIALYRTLLKLLYVTLRAQVRAFGQNDAQTSAKVKESDSYAGGVAQTVLSILDITVAKGFRTLVSLIHDSDTSVSPEDIALLTAILQACLCIPGIDQSQTQVLNIMAAHDAVHVAVSLYSWSDKLAEQGDPVYGELSLLFLLELSALPLVAEQLACDGLLNHITSANLAAYLRRPNISPFSESVGPQRCYSIWAKGIVPLLLNILTSLGTTIAPEVAYVLNQFPNLMKSSVERFDVPVSNRIQSSNSRAYITLLSVSEMHSLALMTRVLGLLRANNARDVPAVAWDSDKALENVDFWLSSRKLLRERLVPLGPREAEWKGMPPTKRGRASACESLLEEKVVEQLKGVRTVLGEEFE